MNETSLLEALGLKPAESNIYLSLLENGPDSIRGIAAQTNINRGTTYESLKVLITRGLVSFNQKGERKKYIAENPDKILELLEDKKREMAKLDREAQTVIPALQALSYHRGDEPFVRFYEDDEGIATILRDVLATMTASKTQEYYVYSSRPIRQYLYRSFPNFTRRRIKEGIFVKVIAVGEGGDPAETSERKWLAAPSDEHVSSYTLIYGTKIAMISVAADDTPYGVIIDEPGAAAMQRLLFTQLWNKLS